MKLRTARRLNARAYRFRQSYSYRAGDGGWVHVSRRHRSQSACGIIRFSSSLPAGTRVEVRFGLFDEVG